MIAKLIASGENRNEAIAELADILDNVEVWPVRTNAAFLFNALTHPDFEAGRIGTGFIEQHLADLVPDPEPDETIQRAGATVAILAAQEEASLPGLAGLRLNAPPRLAVSFGGRTVALGDEDEVAEVSGFADGERVVVFAEGQAYEFGLASRGTGTTHGLHDGEIEAPMPGKVTAVEVRQGEKVVNGQRLLTLEAMKMEHALTAPFDGTVTELNAKAGAQVTEGTLLVKVEPEPSKD
jgi:3-methylcrotonyl-CoA carboxylase alpha subunit